MFCMDVRKKTAIIPLHINCVLFINRTECVYCAVRAEYLTITQANPILLGANMQRFYIYTVKSIL